MLKLASPCLSMQRSQRPHNFAPKPTECGQNLLKKFNKAEDVVKHVEGKEIFTKDKVMRIQSRIQNKKEETPIPSEKHDEPKQPTTMEEMGQAGFLRTFGLITHAEMEEYKKRRESRPRRNCTRSATKTELKRACKSKREFPQPQTNKRTKLMPEFTCSVCTRKNLREKLSSCQHCYELFHLSCHVREHRALRGYEKWCPSCLKTDLNQRNHGLKNQLISMVQQVEILKRVKQEIEIQKKK